MGGSIIKQGSGWGRLLVYVVALRFAMTNLQKVFSTITGINRFYPQVRRYFLFVQSFEQKDQEDFSPLQEYELRLNGQQPESILEGSSQGMHLRPGSFLALITQLELSRYTLADMLRGLLGEEHGAFKAAMYSARFATTRHSCPGCSLRRVLNLPESAGWNDADLPEGILQRLKKQLPGNLDKDIKPTIWETVEPDSRFALSLASALASDAQWILMEEKGLRLLDQETRAFFQERMAERIAVIVYNNSFSRVGGYGEPIAAVMDQSGLIGLGGPQWFASVQEEVEDRLQQKGSGKPAGAKGVEEYDELDEEA